MSESPSCGRIYSLVGLMTVLWSLNYIVAKYALREFPAMLASGMRMIIAGSIMLAVYRWNRANGSIPPWTRRDVGLLAFLGVIGVGLNQFFFVLGISMTTVSHAAIVAGLTPVTVLLLASAMGMERLGIVRLGGMFVALAGVFTLQMSSSQTGGATALGDIFIYLASFTFAVFTVRGKQEASRLGGVVVNTFAYAGSAVAMLPITAGYAWAFPFRNVSWVAWLSLLYMAVFPSVVCYSIYYYALRHVPASRVAAFQYLQPLLAMIMAIVILGENATTGLMSGGALVLLGVFLAEKG